MSDTRQSETILAAIAAFLLAVILLPILRVLSGMFVGWLIYTVFGSQFQWLPEGVTLVQIGAALGFVSLFFVKGVV